MKIFHGHVCKQNDVIGTRPCTCLPITYNGDSVCMFVHPRRNSYTGSLITGWLWIAWAVQHCMEGVRLRLLGHSITGPT